MSNADHIPYQQARLAKQKAYAKEAQEGRDMKREKRNEARERANQRVQQSKSPAALGYSKEDYRNMSREDRGHFHDEMKSHRKQVDEQQFAKRKQEQADHREFMRYKNQTSMPGMEHGDNRIGRNVNMGNEATQRRQEDLLRSQAARRAKDEERWMQAKKEGKEWAQNLDSIGYDHLKKGSHWDEKSISGYEQYQSGNHKPGSYNYATGQAFGDYSQGPHRAPRNAEAKARQAAKLQARGGGNRQQPQASTYDAPPQASSTPSWQKYMSMAGAGY